MKVEFNPPIPANTKGTTTITTSEADLLTITDLNTMSKSQLSAYFDVTLGSATSVKFRYYYSLDNTTWFSDSVVKSSSTGVLADIPTVLDATSPAQSTNIRVIENIPMPGAQYMKITGQSVAANATLNSLKLVFRDN